MRKRKILFICHNHPKIRPGGAEAYAYELFTALRGSDRFEPIFLAKGGPPLSKAGSPHPGTLFSPVEGAEGEYFLYTDGYEYDWLFGSMVKSKDFYTKHFRDFLVGIQPDIVHFQHTLFLGYDLIRQVKNTLPDVPIVYTLHEFLPICHRQGQLVRTVDDEPCMEESPRRCHECFPEISPQTFFMRKRFIQSHLELVDLFLAPSQFLLERYVDWGIPRDKIRFEDYGRQVRGERLAEEPRTSRTRLGFFGQVTFYKGVEVLLEAMALLARDAEAVPVRDDEAAREPHLWVHGGNLDLQSAEFRDRLDALLQSTKSNVTFVGRYDHVALPALMANVDWVVVPSIWWENSPLVIQEAFWYGRPVICSDIGGMAEKVEDGVSGLHFRAGDPMSLSAAIRRATETPGLWDELHGRLSTVYGMDEHIDSLTEIYEHLVRQQPPATAGVVGAG